MCPDCNKDLVLCQGNVRIHHFRHKTEKENKCTYYDKPSEAQVHKDAKLLLKKLLEDKRNIKFTRNCECCDDNFTVDNIPEMQTNSKIVVEYRFNFNNSVKSADVAHIINNKLISVFEIYNTHKTKDTDRPEPWYEISASELIETVNEVGETSSELNIRCIRQKGRCNECLLKEQKKKERKEHLIHFFKLF